MLLTIWQNNHWTKMLKISEMYWTGIWKNKQSVTNESVQIKNIEISTQLSKEDSESYDDDFNTLNGYSDNSYREYKRKIKRSKTYHLPYKKLNINAYDDINDDDSDSFWSGLKKKENWTVVHWGCNKISWSHESAWSILYANRYGDIH